MMLSHLRAPMLAALAALLACGKPSTRHPAPVPSRELRDEPAGVTQAGSSVSGGPSHNSPALTSNDLDNRSAALFGSSLRLESSLPMPPDSAALGGGDGAPTWDIDVRSYETFDRVRYYVSRFSGPARSRIADRLSEGTRYESMIRTRMRQGGLPEDMYYLALVESGFNPHAYSRAAAVGMWQFMTTTARGMGLRVDWWVDERRDPVRSTEAAVRFLRGLNEQFGSMYLAAAAYNGGPGRIARGLTRYEEDLEGIEGDDMFFALAEKKYLKDETREYVPQLIAAALVAKEPARYGLDVQARPLYEYDSVWVGPRVPLKAIATASGASVDVIRELNSHVLRGMTPPRDSFKVRIPVGSRLRFDSAFAELPPQSVTGAKIVVAKSGATWASIAKAEKITARSLPLYNPKVKAAKKTGRIAAGTRVLVPTSDVVAAAFAVPDPAVERYGSSNRSHIVRRGENLSVIAKRYGTSSAAIMRLNRLKKPIIFPGQELLVNGRTAATRSKASVKPGVKKATASKR